MQAMCEFVRRRATDVEIGSKLRTMQSDRNAVARERWNDGTLIAQRPQIRQRCFPQHSVRNGRERQRLREQWLCALESLCEQIGCGADVIEKRWPVVLASAQSCT